MKQLAAVLAAVCLCGCGAVYVDRPIGERPLAISNPEQWEGTWLHRDGAIVVKVTDASNGVLSVGWFEKEEGGLKPATGEVFLCEARNWTLATLKTPDAATNRMVWGRISMEDGQAIVWSPDAGRFMELVTNGVLPGTTNGRNVVLGSLASNHWSIITEGTNGVLFNWDAPLILRRHSSR